jgi:ATP/maltotriose-dependent transcriptional regulator MalT
MEGRTEEWIAALQLAALSMQGEATSQASLLASQAMTATLSTTW